MVRVSVFGMGYVGCVAAACLARDGHRVVGVDVSPVKLDALRRGESPIGEPGLDVLIRDAVAAGNLRVTHDAQEAIQQTDIALVCVGTPSNRSGGLDLSYVSRVCEQIGAALATAEPGFVVCIRSTMLPGSLANVVRPTLELTSGRREGETFFLAMNPEFLREGTAIRDYDDPPKIVLGTRSPTAEALLRELYARLHAPLFVVDPEVAEMVKYADNTWHATKVAFANEIGEVCHAAGVDSHAVMNVFLEDRHLNLSPYYLRPGFAFGGSCLPKDLRALTYHARHHDIELPLLQGVLQSNERLIEVAARRILDSGARRVGFYGLAFKPNTDDLRESPLVSLAERLLGKGVQLRIYDEAIQPHRLTGTNRLYIESLIPHFMALLVDGFEALEKWADLVVVGHRTPASEAWARRRDPQVPVLDLARVGGLLGQPNVSGVSW